MKNIFTAVATPSPVNELNDTLNNTTAMPLITFETDTNVALINRFLLVQNCRHITMFWYIKTTGLLIYALKACADSITMLQVFIFKF
jgi:hypothetical protein